MIHSVSAIQPVSPLPPNFMQEEFEALEIAVNTVTIVVSSEFLNQVLLLYVEFQVSMGSTPHVYLF